MVVSLIRVFTIILLLLCAISANAQDSVRPSPPFLEIGAGYLFNIDGTASYFPEDILIDHTNFDHGATAYLHFGLPVFKLSSFRMGIAGKYALHMGLQFRNKIANYYEKEYPDLTFEYNTPPWFFHNMQLGPFISSPIVGKWSADLELLFGYARVRAPALTILGERESEYHVYVSRIPINNFIRIITPSLGIKRYYSKNKYVFFRPEVTFGLGNLRMDYHDYYPDGQSFSYEVSKLTKDYSYNYYLFNFLIGTNITIGE